MPLNDIRCHFDEDDNSVEISWPNINDDFFIRNFLFTYFGYESSSKHKKVSVPLGNFLSKIELFIEFRNAEYDRIDNLIVDEKLKDYYSKIPDYSNAIEANFILDEASLQEQLDLMGFKRTLTTTQIRNVSKISNLPAAADFSVPGAGKTTEALAVYLLNKNKFKLDNYKCLVVCPRNVFTAWEEEIRLCLGQGYSTVVLQGENINIERQLNKSHDFFLINYELLRARSELPKLISSTLGAKNTNFQVIADESHRMKGRDGSTANAMMTLASITPNKLILTGTPCPQSDEDLISQFQFLYPKEKIDNSDEAAKKFQKIFVRTTKADLEQLLPPINEELISINYSGIFRETYDLIFREAKKFNFDLSTRQGLRAFKEILIRMIRLCSNPQLVLSHIFEIDGNLGERLADEGIGPKLKLLIRDAKNLINSGEKVLIWSHFPQNIRIICKELEIFGANPVQIHGGIPMGDQSDGHLTPGTRRHAIYEFNNNTECKAFVANPAAAGEGISLHKVCRNAFYADRLFNVAHYLQSKDRIHRIGGDVNKPVNIKIYSISDTIDESITVRLKDKIRNMSKFLDDPSIISNSIDFEISLKNDDEYFYFFDDGDIDFYTKYFKNK